MTEEVLQRAIRKASRSSCTHKVSAIGLDARGHYLDSAVNGRRMFHRGGGIHAEMALIRKAGPQLKTIILCRVNGSGECRPIHPCNACQKLIDKLGLKVVTIAR